MKRSQMVSRLSTGGIQFLARNAFMISRSYLHELLVTKQGTTQGECPPMSYHPSIMKLKKEYFTLKEKPEKTGSNIQ